VRLRSGRRLAAEREDQCQHRLLRTHPLMRRRLTPVAATATSGGSHHAATPAVCSSQVTTSAAATAAATVAERRAVATGPTVAPDRVSRRHANRLISIGHQAGAGIKRRRRWRGVRPVSSAYPTAAGRGSSSRPQARWRAPRRCRRFPAASYGPCPATYATPALITRFGRRRITRFGTNLQKTRRAALDATGPAMSSYPAPSAL
jgi:hypothetical protein